MGASKCPGRKRSGFRSLKLHGEVRDQRLFQKLNTHVDQGFRSALLAKPLANRANFSQPSRRLEPPIDASVGLGLGVCALVTALGLHILERVTSSVPGRGSGTGEPFPVDVAGGCAGVFDTSTWAMTTRQSFTHSHPLTRRAPARDQAALLLVNAAARPSWFGRLVQP